MCGAYWCLGCLRAWFVWACRCVNTRIGQAKPLDGLATQDVAVDDFGHIRFCHAAVPNRVRIHDHRWAMLALIEAPGLVGANTAVQAAVGQRFLERLLQPIVRVRITRPARMTGLALIAADEDVSFERRH
jgi:hypothetical protein